MGRTVSERTNSWKGQLMAWKVHGKDSKWKDKFMEKTVDGGEISWEGQLVERKVHVSTSPQFLFSTFFLTFSRFLFSCGHATL